jgi:hypothetical protein
MPPHRQHVYVQGVSFSTSVQFFYAGTPDYPASDHSGTGMKKNANAGTSPVSEQGNPVRKSEVNLMLRNLNSHPCIRNHHSSISNPLDPPLFWPYNTFQTQP